MQLYGRVPGLLAEFEEVVSSVQRDDKKLEGHIRIMAPTTLTLMHLSQTFSAFMAQHERITLEIALVDLSSNPEEQACDLAISGRVASYEGVIDLPLCSTQRVLVAAPDYLGKHALTLSHPRELIEHPCLVFSPSGKCWNFQGKRGVRSVEVTPRLLADDNITLLHAAIQGLGIAVLPNYIAAEAIANGALEHLLPDYPLQETWFRAYVPKRRLQIARVQALIDWITADLKQFSEGWRLEA